MRKTLRKLGAAIQQIAGPETPVPPASVTRTPAVERMLAQVKALNQQPISGVWGADDARVDPSRPHDHYASRPGIRDVRLPPIVVLMTTIPARQASFIRVLRALARQTHKPSRVLIRLDKQDESTDAWHAEVMPELSNLALAGVHFIVWQDSNRGAGFRWRHPALRELERDTLLFTIDDDIVPHSDFIEITARLSVYDCAAVTWHGWTERQGGPQQGALHTPARADLRVCCVGAGVSCYRWRWVETLVNHALATELLFSGPTCDDDALLALHLYQTGVYVLRPAGAAPCAETDDSRGATATHKRFGLMRHGQRLALALAFDAPLITHEFPGPLGAESTFIHTFTAAISDTDERRARLHRAATNTLERKYGGLAQFFVQLEPALLELSSDAMIVEWGLSRATRWLGMYAIMLGYRHVVNVVNNLQADWLLSQPWHPSVVHIMGNSVPMAPKSVDLLVIAHNHDDLITPLHVTSSVPPWLRAAASNIVHLTLP